MTTWTREPANTDRERKIITAMVVSTEALKAISRAYEPRFLDINYMRSVAAWCLAHLEKYGVAPGRDVQEIFLKHSRNGLDPDQAGFINEFLASISEEYEDEANEAGQWKFDADQARDYFEERKLQLFREDLEQASGNKAAAWELIKKFQAEAQAEQGKDLGEAVKEAVMPFREFSQIEIPKPRCIVGDWLEEDSINLISSPPGVGKTWLAMETAAAPANWRDAMGGLWPVNSRWPTLYIDGEMSPAVIQERGRMVGQVGLGSCELLSKVWLEARDVPPLNLAEEAVRQMLLDYIVERQFRLVVIDNLFSLFVGLDTNSATDWGPPNQWLLKLRAKGVATLLLHHTGKSETQLGTSSREFNANLSLILKDARGAENGDNCAFTIKVTKQRSRSLGLQGKKYLCVDGRWTVTALKGEEEAERMRMVAKMLDAGEKTEDIAAAVGRSPGTVSSIRGKLVEQDLILEEGRGVHKRARLTDKGRGWVDDGS